MRVGHWLLWGIDAHPHFRLLQLQRGSRIAPRAPLGLLHRSTMFSIAPSALSRLQYAPESCNSNRAPTGLLQLRQGSCSSNAAPAASNCSYTRVAFGLIGIQPFCAIAHSLGASQLIVLLSQLWDQRCRAPTAPTRLLQLQRSSCSTKLLIHKSCFGFNRHSTLLCDRT